MTYSERWLASLNTKTEKKKNTLALSDTSISLLSSASNNQIVRHVKDKAGH